MNTHVQLMKSGQLKNCASVNILLALDDESITRIGKIEQTLLTSVSRKCGNVQLSDRQHILVTFTTVYVQNGGEP